MLGTPLRHDTFQKAALLAKRCQHDLLLPSLPNLQTAWMLLLMCASPRSSYLLGTMQPSTTAGFAARHDRAIMDCLSELLGNDGPLHLDDQTLQRANLPLRLGGLGLRSAEAGRCAACWASWADTLLDRPRPRTRASAPARVDRAYWKGTQERSPPASPAFLKVKTNKKKKKKKHTHTHTPNPFSLQARVQKDRVSMSHDTRFWF